MSDVEAARQRAIVSLAGNLSPSIEQDARVLRERFVGDVSQMLDVDQGRLYRVGRVGAPGLVEIERVYATA